MIRIIIVNINQADFIMPVKWKVYRIICVVQMLAAAVFAIISLVNFFQTGSLGDILRLVLFVFIFLLTILAVNIVNNNYPDVPVTGKQKTNFNSFSCLISFSLFLCSGSFFPTIKS
ncbi:MAG: hypothetical protein WDO16_05585 [Bacteroidota bacterium]